MMITMGEDFTYQEAEHYFKNLDFLIDGINSLESTKDKYNAVYSTPACYYNAVSKEFPNDSLPEKFGDFFPYCDGNGRPYEPKTRGLHDYSAVVYFLKSGNPSYSLELLKAKFGRRYIFFHKF